MSRSIVWLAFLPVLCLTGEMPLRVFAQVDEAAPATAPATVPESAAEKENAEKLPVFEPYDPQDWREAGGPDDKWGDRIRTCTVIVREDRTLHCRIFRLDATSHEQEPVTKLEVKLVRDGQVIETTTPKKEDGSFQFEPVKPGIYSLIGHGDDGFVAFSFHVATLPEEKSDKDKPEGEDNATPVSPAAQEEVEQTPPAAQTLDLVETCVLDPADMPLVFQLIQSFLGVGAASGGDIELENADKPAEEANDDPAETLSRRRRPLPAEADDAPETIGSTTVHWRSIRIREDGLLLGRVRLLFTPPDDPQTVQTRPPRDMRVFFIKDGRTVAQAPCSPKGFFVLQDLKPDVYSFVGVGLDGFVATSVDVLPAEEQPEGGDQGTIKNASFRRMLLESSSIPSFDGPVVPIGDTTQLPTEPVTTVPTPTVAGELTPIPLTGTPAAVAGSTGASSAFPGFSGPSSNVGTPPSGGFGGGGGGSNGGGGGTTGGGAVPEIDPTSSGVGLTLLIGFLLLMMDLYRPR